MAGSYIKFAARMAANMFVPSSLTWWSLSLSLFLSLSLSNDLVFNRILERRQLLRQPKSSPRPHNNNSIQHSHYLNVKSCPLPWCAGTLRGVLLFFFLPRQIRAKWNYIVVLHYKVCLLSCLLFAWPLPSRIYQIIEPKKFFRKKKNA
jgi:hypothetical protein